MNAGYRYLGQGIYSISEAAVLSGVTASKISRWVRGYSYTRHAMDARSAAVFERDFEEISGKTALSFLDLVEVQFVDWFRSHGVSWKSIRIAADRASQLLKSTRPFAMRQFFTDGKTIFARITKSYEYSDLIDLVRRQYEINEILSPLLYARLDFNDADTANRWWPMGRDRGVVVDPQLSFGKPVVERFGIPTRVIAESYRTIGSEGEVADWFEIDIKAVRDALDFEQVALVA